MKDLIDKILKYLPQFFLDCGELISHPQRFIAARDTESNDTFTEACLFLAISVSLGVLVGLPFRRPDVDFWVVTAQYLESNALVVVCFGLVTRFAWLIVRGKASAKSVFVAYMYFIGALNLMVTFLSAMLWGFVKLTDRALFDEMIADRKINSGPVPGEFIDRVPLGGNVLMVLGLVAIIAWCCIAWGAYRPMNQVGRARTVAAAAVALVLAVPAGIVYAYVNAAIQS